MGQGGLYRDELGGVPGARRRHRLCAVSKRAAPDSRHRGALCPRQDICSRLHVPGGIRRHPGHPAQGLEACRARGDHGAELRVCGAVRRGIDSRRGGRGTTGARGPPGGSRFSLRQRRTRVRCADDGHGLCHGFCPRLERRGQCHRTGGGRGIGGPDRRQRGGGVHGAVMDSVDRRRGDRPGAGALWLPRHGHGRHQDHGSDAQPRFRGHPGRRHDRGPGIRHRPAHLHDPHAGGGDSRRRDRARHGGHQHERA